MTIDQYEDALEININSDTKFEPDNYFQFNIDLSSNKLFKYHEMKLIICTKDLKVPHDDCYDYDIAVRGSQFMSTIPKSIFNKAVFFDHDPKWYIKDEKMYVSSVGLFGNRISNKKNEFDEKKLIDIFKDHEEKNLILSNLIENKSGIKDTCIFMNNSEDFLNDNFCGLIYLVSKIFYEYLESKKYLQTKTFSFGHNILIGNNFQPTVCEINEIDTIKLYWNIPRHGDMVKHFEFIFSAKKKSK
jgi:hypothetical protein